MIWQRRELIAFIKFQGYQEGVLWRWLLCESAVLLTAGCSIGAVFGLYAQLLGSHFLATVTGFPIVFDVEGVAALSSFALVSVDRGRDDRRAGLFRGACAAEHRQPGVLDPQPRQPASSDGTSLIRLPLSSSSAPARLGCRAPTRELLHGGCPPSPTRCVAGGRSPRAIPDAPIRAGRAERARPASAGTPTAPRCSRSFRAPATRACCGCSSPTRSFGTSSTASTSTAPPPGRQTAASCTSPWSTRSTRRGRSPTTTATTPGMTTAATRALVTACRECCAALAVL